MLHIILLAFASAASLTPQLLAVVLIILTRPNPEPLLWAFWVTALVVSIGLSFIVLIIFRAKGAFLGTTSTKVSPTAYLIVGVIALAVAVFAATKRGRELLGREVERLGKGGGKTSREGSIGDRVSVKAEQVRSKAEAAMKRGSVLVAIVVGVVLGAPTAFSLGAIGLIVTNGYRLPTQLLLIVGFSLITYVVVEVPIISYTVRPEGTTARVERFSAWLSAHKIQAVAAVVGIVGLVLLVKGFTSL